MTLVTPDELARALAAKSAHDSSYWSFPSVGRRKGAHALFNYPAMMVPEVQGALLDVVLDTGDLAESGSVYDPFLGAGTMVVESLVRGLNLYGTDLNPLAILLSKVKAEPPTIEDIDEFVLSTTALSHDMDLSAHAFQKWFHADVASQLAEIRTRIRAHGSLVGRRFLWICLAETVRRVSNSRSSTFKLHIYSAADLARRSTDAHTVFGAVIRENRERIRTYLSDLSVAPTARAEVSLTAVQSDPSTGEYDILMTSPPYGDNKTTVPYGQYSYLPLLFIDFEDIPGDPPQSLLDTTSRIDSFSLGGSLQGVDALQAPLLERLPSLASTLSALENQGHLKRKVVSFMNDYQIAVSAAVQRVKPGGLCFWTLGERRVGGYVIPLVAVTSEIASLSGQTEVCVIQRQFPTYAKRMARRNNIGETMSAEKILVTRMPK